MSKAAATLFEAIEYLVDVAQLFFFLVFLARTQFCSVPIPTLFLPCFCVSFQSNLTILGPNVSRANKYS